MPLLLRRGIANKQIKSAMSCLCSASLLHVHATHIATFHMVLLILVLFVFVTFTVSDACWGPSLVYKVQPAHLI